MPPTVQFFFGLGSRYSYLAATQVPKLARETGARFIWRALYSRELIERAGPDPFRAELRRGQYDPGYRTQDAVRWARYYGIPYIEPLWDTVDWRALANASVAAELLGVGEAFALALFQRCFADGRPPLAESELSGIAASVGIRADDFAAAINSQATKDRHEKNMDDALAAGVFGVPSFLAVDGELFWGQDRLVLLRQHLLEGNGPVAEK